jgi:hypothetical protein
MTKSMGMCTCRSTTRLHWAWSGKRWKLLLVTVRERRQDGNSLVVISRDPNYELNANS